MADWSTMASFATAGGTLVLAAATFVSVRSANRAARAAERSLLAGLRPVLVPSRLQDDPQKVLFVDAHWVRVPGGGGVAEATADAIYLAMSLRNVGAGLAVLHGWTFHPERVVREQPSLREEDFVRLTRDIYVPPGDVGFWQGAFREPSSPAFAAARAAIEARDGMTIDLLYGDHEGGQRTISRFVMLPRDDQSWIATVGRHWNIDRDDPR